LVLDFLFFVTLLTFNLIATFVGMAGYSENPKFNICTEAKTNSRFSTYVVPGYKLGCYLSKPIKDGVCYMAAPAGSND
jgi:hypothetical protein